MPTVEFTDTSFVHYFTFRKVRSKAPAYSPSKSGYNAKQYEPIPRKRTQLISESLTTQASLFFSVNILPRRNKHPIHHTHRIDKCLSNH